MKIDNKNSVRSTNLSAMSNILFSAWLITKSQQCCGHYKQHCKTTNKHISKNSWRVQSINHHRDYMANSILAGGHWIFYQQSRTFDIIYLTWNRRIMVQMSPSVRRGLPSTISWAPTFSRCTRCSLRKLRDLSTFSRQ